MQQKTDRVFFSMNREEGIWTQDKNNYTHKEPLPSLSSDAVHWGQKDKKEAE